MISQRTKEAVACLKSEGRALSRPQGSFSGQTKLTGKEEAIKELSLSGNLLGSI